MYQKPSALLVQENMLIVKFTLQYRHVWLEASKCYQGTEKDSILDMHQRSTIPSPPILVVFTSVLIVHEQDNI